SATVHQSTRRALRDPERKLSRSFSNPNIHQQGVSSAIFKYPTENDKLTNNNDRLKRSSPTEAAVVFNDPDSDNDSIDFIPMDSMGAQPEIFRGCLADDAESWLKFMDIWLETRRANLNDRNRMCYAATFFREAALTWFHSLTIVNPPAPGQQVSGGDVCNNEGDNENDEDH